MIGKFDSIFGGLSHIHIESIILKESFIDFSSRFYDDSGTVILLSSNNTNSINSCSRYNILGCFPWLHFHGKNQEMNITIDGNIIKFKADPLKTLNNLIKRYVINNFDVDIPILSGLMGYLSYDLKNSFKKVPVTTFDDNCLPDICFFVPSIIVVNDMLENKTQMFVSSSKYGGINSQKKAIKKFNERLEEPLKINKNFYSDGKGYSSNLTYNEYINSIEKIKKYIIEGDVYQVNMSQRFNAKFEGDSFAFFKKLYQLNPAPFFAYINANNHKIISTSPERLIMQNQYKVETCPIKGTRPRGENSDIDNLMKKELLGSYKDDAELSMIVDLLRNDLGKVCRVDSINVVEHKKIECYNNVYHLVSKIQGELDASNNSIDLIKAVFPGGSITGCPKIRSMEIIDELEVNRRHVYTGSIGYISFHKTMDLSVAIRTATLVNNKLYFSVGGGIVYDSNPDDEFKETLHKGKTIMDVLNSNSSIIDSKSSSTIDSKSYSDYMPWVWFNGGLLDLKKVNIPIYDLGFMYGFGFFETLLMEKNKIHLLKDHIKRFNKSWKKLFNTIAPNLTWTKVIEQVVKANKLKDEIIVIKILATRGNIINKNLFNGSIVVFAKKYKQRLCNTSERGLKVAIYPESRHTPLADYKTINYLYYYLAGTWAIDHGFNEAIILNYNGSISEGNSSNIFLIYDNIAVIPESKFVLPGVMLSLVKKKFISLGYKINIRPVFPVELFSADSIYLTNSIMKIRSVISVNNKPISVNLELEKKIKNII